MSTADLSLVLLALAVVLLLLGSVGNREGRDVQYRLRRLEAKVDALLAHAGVAVTGPELVAVQEHLARGEKIAAVRAYREATGAGLADAKHAVDRLERGEGP